ncbi:hypothetical protein SAMN05428976_103150 [Clostridium sp. USBA 49]|uniref:hypothetical protein n=1 Tax=Clostridium TaxID=1485 RepID=UPI00099A1C82|nr:MULTISPECIES: hypothetical protein [Clostridium]SKA78835.1 hypothetical protein SAMN05428976_103150 [Clostridium sp. USBA 49]
MELKDKDLELIERGTKALINELGYSGFIKYISRVQICNGNYFRNKEVVYKNIDSKDNKEDIR